MKALAIALMFLGLSTVVKAADYLDCANNKPEQTDIGFYNNYGQVSFQMSVPYKGEFLYLIGLCDSQHQSHIGLPYKCEVDSQVVELSLISGANKIPTAEVIIHADGGTTSKELIPCHE